MSPRDFWKNYREVSDEHMSEVIQAVTNTSVEYQTELANGATEA